MASAIERRMLALPVFGPARTILLFSSFGSEVPTSHLIDRLVEGGKRVLLPAIRQAEMEAAEYRPGSDLAATTYGPKEPADGALATPEEVDVAVVPGLAFDRQGHRLGRGGGHFDRYLRRMLPEATRVGIAVHAQVVPAVPHGPRDERVDFVVTDQESIVCHRR